MITQARLKELLRYEESTGEFFWAVNRRRARAGNLAGNVESTGYWHIMIDYKAYLAHRLVWLYVHGQLPTQQIDHINGDKLDNRLCNLRLTSQRQNMQNRKEHRQGRLVGALFCKRQCKWISRISVDGRRLRLGSFSTEQEAHAAYLQALTQLKE